MKRLFFLGCLLAAVRMFADTADDALALAQRTLAGLPGNLPSVSGARGPRILGAIHPG